MSHKSGNEPLNWTEVSNPTPKGEWPRCERLVHEVRMWMGHYIAAFVNRGDLYISLNHFITILL